MAFSMPAFARADYPNKSIKIIVPFNPGGGREQGARLLEKDFKETIGQPLSFIYKLGGTGVLSAWLNSAVRSRTAIRSVSIPIPC